MQPQKFLKKMFFSDDAPKKKKPVEAPVPDDLKAKRRKQRQNQSRRRSGRTSTIFNDSKLG